MASYVVPTRRALLAAGALASGAGVFLALFTLPDVYPALGLAFWVLFGAAFLGLPFLLGLSTTERWMWAILPLAYTAAIGVLWAASPAFARDVTYDLSVVGVVLFKVMMPWLWMGFAFALGRALR